MTIFTIVGIFIIFMSVLLHLVEEKKQLKKYREIIERLVEHYKLAIDDYKEAIEKHKLLVEKHQEIAKSAIEKYIAYKTVCSYALADLEGIMPEFEPSGDRTHPGWKTIEDLKKVIRN